MAAGADRVLKSDILAMPSVHSPREAKIRCYTHSSRVDSNAVILIVTVRTGNHNIRRASNVEAVGILSLAVTGRIVDGHVSDGKSVRAVDADGLDRSVLDVQVGDSRGGEVMRVEELGLRHAARATLAIPVLGPAAIEDGTGRALNGDGLALDLQEGPGPLFVAPGCGALENDLFMSGLDVRMRLKDVERRLHLRWYHPRGRRGLEWYQTGRRARTGREWRMTSG